MGIINEDGAVYSTEQDAILTRNRKIAQEKQEERELASALEIADSPKEEKALLEIGSAVKVFRTAVDAYLSDAPDNVGFAYESRKGLVQDTYSRAMSLLAAMPYSDYFSTKKHQVFYQSKALVRMEGPKQMDLHSLVSSHVSRVKDKKPKVKSSGTMTQVD